MSSQQQSVQQAQAAAALKQQLAAKVKPIAAKAPMSWSAVAASAKTVSVVQAKATKPAASGPKRTYTIRGAILKHVGHAQDGAGSWGLPTTEQGVINVVAAHYDEFEWDDSAGTYWYTFPDQVATWNNKRKAYEDRNWSVAIDEPTPNAIEIFHYGPTSW